MTVVSYHALETRVYYRALALEKATLHLCPYRKLTFSRIPKDLLVKIFSFLGKKDKERFCLAAPRYALQLKAAKSTQKWGFELDASLKKNPKLTKKDILEKLSNVENLACAKLRDRKGCFSFTAAELEVILTENPTLEELRIQMVGAEQDDYTRVLSIYGKNLRTLRLFQEGGIAFQSIPKLERLTYLFIDEPHICDEDLQPLRTMPFLKTLKITSAPFISNAGIQNTISRIASLTSLTLEGNFPLDDEAFISLGALPHLEELDLSGTSVTDAALLTFGSLSKLKNLHLNSCPEVTAEGCSALQAQLPDLAIQRS